MPKLEGDRMTALHIAANKSNIDAVTLLLEMDDIDVGIRNAEGRTALDEAARQLKKLESHDQPLEAAFLRARTPWQLLNDYEGSATD